MNCTTKGEWALRIREVSGAEDSGDDSDGDSSDTVSARAKFIKHLHSQIPDILYKHLFTHNSLL